MEAPTLGRILALLRQPLFRVFRGTPPSNCLRLHPLTRATEQNIAVGAGNFSSFRTDEVSTTFVDSARTTFTDRSMTEVCTIMLISAFKPAR